MGGNIWHFADSMDPWPYRGRGALIITPPAITSKDSFLSLLNLVCGTTPKPNGPESNAPRAPTKKATLWIKGIETNLYLRRY